MSFELCTSLQALAEEQAARSKAEELAAQMDKQRVQQQEEFSIRLAKELAGLVCHGSMFVASHTMQCAHVDVEAALEPSCARQIAAARVALFVCMACAGFVSP